jgi:hypothetical protein
MLRLFQNGLCFPDAAFASALEQLRKRQGRRDVSALVSPARYVTSLLKDWHDDGRYKTNGHDAEAARTYAESVALRDV